MEHQIQHRLLQSLHAQSPRSLTLWVHLLVLLENLLDRAAQLLS